MIPLAYSPVPDNVSSTDQYITAGACLVAPLSRGNMTISSNDTNDLPVINPNWMTDSGDLEVALQAVRRVQAWINASGIATAQFQPDSSIQTDNETIEWIKDTGGLIYHPTSSCTFRWLTIFLILAVAKICFRCYGCRRRSHGRC